MLELYEKHVIELGEVFLHVVHSHTARQLEENCVNASIEFTLHFADLGVVLLVGLGVLVHPVLAVRDYLVHTSLQIFMPQSLLLHLCAHIRHLLSNVSLRADHHILDLFEIFLVLIELLLQSHGCVDSLFQVHFGLVDLFCCCLELFRVIAINGLKFLVLKNQTLIMYQLAIHGSWHLPILAGVCLGLQSQAPVARVS